MYYLIRHLTRYDFAGSISENVMTVHLLPRSDGNQRCLSFDLKVQPHARIFTYRDYLGNHVHHFDIAAKHDCLVISAEALVETLRAPRLPEALRPDTWGALDELLETEDYWEMLLPSTFARPTRLLREFLLQADMDQRKNDPLTTVRNLNHAIHTGFKYEQGSTHVDSGIDDTLRTGRGVCQDFAHIMIAALRQLRIPARYVSGYLYHREVGEAFLVDDATHAWVEALLPELGWVGFDPTTDMLCGSRHIRTAVGRDYADIPPTRGVYKGSFDGALSVSVRVWPWGSGLSVADDAKPVPSGFVYARRVDDATPRIGEDQ